MSVFLEEIHVDATLHQKVAGTYKQSTTVLASGQKYLLVVDGNWTAWPAGTAYGYGLGNTIPIKYASPSVGTTAGWWAQGDAEFFWSAPESGYAGIVGPSNHAHHLQWNFNGTTSFGGRVEEPVAGIPSAYRSDFTYTYEVTGQGYPMRATDTDANITGNNGVIKIRIYSQGGWTVGAVSGYGAVEQ